MDRARARSCCAGKSLIKAANRSLASSSVRSRVRMAPKQRPGRTSASSISPMLCKLVVKMILRPWARTTPSATVRKRCRSTLPLAPPSWSNRLLDVSKQLHSEGGPHCKYADHTQKVGAKAVQDPIVRHVNEAMRTAKQDKCPSQPELQCSDLARHIECRTNRKEQDGKLEQVAKVIGCGDVLKAYRGLATRGKRLRIHATCAHFCNSDYIHAHGHNQRQ